DGTVADTFEHMLAVFNLVSGRKKPLSTDEIDQLRKLSSRQALKAVGIPLYRVPGLVKRGMSSFQARIPKMRSFPKLPDTLRALNDRGDRLFILTSNTEENVDLFLSHVKLRQYFEAFCCEAKLFGKAKHIKSMIRYCGLNPDETWYVGDETRDITAA